MTDPTRYAREFAGSSMDAFTGYASAAFAAYADLAGQAFGCWAQAVDAMVPGAQARSWYRHPDQATSRQLSFAWPAPANSPFAFFGMPVAGRTAPAVFNPLALWMNAWPVQGNPASWPLAFALMGMGVSRSVAYPLAQANRAALDAATAAGNAIKDSYSTYRSDGGHASTHVIMDQTKVAATAVMPLALAMATPWLNAFNQLSRVH